MTFLVLGGISAAIVTWMTKDLLQGLRQSADRPRASTGFIGWRLLTYTGWLFVSILKANVQVAYLILHPRMPVAPSLLEFTTGIDHPLGQIVLANSITLTPGTVTVDFHDGRYLVHVLAPAAAQTLVAGQLEHRVTALLGEGPKPAPAVRWIRHLKELGR